MARRNGSWDKERFLELDEAPRGHLRGRAAAGAAQQRVEGDQVYLMKAGKADEAEEAKAGVRALNERIAVLDAERDEADARDEPTLSHIPSISCRLRAGGQGRLRGRAQDRGGSTATSPPRASSPDPTRDLGVGCGHPRLQPRRQARQPLSPCSPAWARRSSARWATSLSTPIASAASRSSGRRSSRTAPATTAPASASSRTTCSTCAPTARTCTSSRPQRSRSPTSTATRPSTARGCRCTTPPSPPASARSHWPAATRAASSASTSSTRSRW